MKKINLDTQFTTLDGKTIVDNEQKPITLKFALLNILGTYQAMNGEEAIKVYDIGIKINNSKKEIELEDSDFELLKKAVSNNKIFISIITAQILKLWQE